MNPSGSDSHVCEVLSGLSGCLAVWHHLSPRLSCALLVMQEGATTEVAAFSEQVELGSATYCAVDMQVLWVVNSLSSYLPW